MGNKNSFHLKNKKSKKNNIDSNREYDIDYDIEEFNDEELDDIYYQDNCQNEKWIELCNILLNDRDNLANFLIENGKYNIIKKCLQDIETNNNMNIEDLFLGKVGDELNKQRALYELPTLELINVIIEICKICDINEIEEIGAGQGLLSKLLSLKLDKEQIGPIELFATDGKMWMETRYPNTYYPIEDKLFIEYATYERNYDNTMMLLSWIPKNGLEDLKLFMEKRKPKYLMVIGEDHNIEHEKFKEFMIGINYTNTHLPIKQLCFKDYYADNKYFPNDSSRSSSQLYVFNDGNSGNSGNNQHNEIKNMMTENKEYFNEKLDKYSNIMILQDLYKGKILPKFVLEIDNNNDLYKFVRESIICITCGYLLPEYLSSLDDFNYWYSKIRQGKYPINIKTRDKFEEYRRKLDKLSNDGIVVMKQENIIPSWIISSDESERYLWLEYSTHDKSWKENRRTFITKFNSIYQNNV